MECGDFSEGGGGAGNEGTERVFLFWCSLGHFLRVKKACLRGECLNFLTLFEWRSRRVEELECSDSPKCYARNSQLNGRAHAWPGRCRNR